MKYIVDSGSFDKLGGYFFSVLSINGNVMDDIVIVLFDSGCEFYF